MASERIVLITGASSGIGLATAQLLGGGGARLFLLGRRADALRTVAEPLGATPLVADVSDPAQLQQAAAAVAARAGRLDLLINCAGQFEVGPAGQLGMEAAERLIRVNYLGTAAAIEALLPLLRRGRRPAIVNVASLAGQVAPPYMAAYAASKFALVGYTRALRQELRPQGIHVGLVLPGPVATPMIAGRVHTEHYPVLPGVPIIAAAPVARAIQQVADRRLYERVVPRRLTIGAFLAAAFPRLVDLVYSRWVAR